MSYRVKFLPEAYDEFASLDKAIAKRIVAKIKWLAENFEDINLHPLRGELRGLFKLRVGSYRVIYSFKREKQIIIIHLVGHRKDIYKSP